MRRVDSLIAALSKRKGDSWKAEEEEEEEAGMKGKVLAEVERPWWGEAGL